MEHDPYYPRTLQLLRSPISLCCNAITLLQRYPFTNFILPTHFSTASTLYQLHTAYPLFYCIYTLPISYCLPTFLLHLLFTDFILPTHFSTASTLYLLLHFLSLLCPSLLYPPLPVSLLLTPVGAHKLSWCCLARALLALLGHAMQVQPAMLCWCRLASYTGCIWPYYTSTVSFVVLPPIGHAKLALLGHVI